VDEELFEPVQFVFGGRLVEIHGRNSSASLGARPGDGKVIATPAWFRRDPIYPTYDP
jgi:hypothetical protein